MSAQQRPAAAVDHRSEPSAPAGAGERPSMRDLLASCAAADAVSTPPRAPERQPAEPERDAA
ncbi:hypothetical protein [Streptomyces luteireticuli]|uniref:Uncharacterized protein n=1 Tax=Streptomyces luteireticuli TaxID=173858 RepID=A0ABP3IY28_9ACTN